jgi:crossover junction endodeoxyribonuclease RuvC
MSIILGLDVSSVSTGWAIIKNGRFYRRENIDFGVIKTTNEDNISYRLSQFRDAVENILSINKPNIVVIEDTYRGPNVNTLKMLVRFGGVAQEITYRVLSIDPILVYTKEARSTIGSQDKEEVFNIIVKKYKLNNFKFKTHNDITDAIVLAIYGNSLKG